MSEPKEPPAFIRANLIINVMGIILLAIGTGYLNWISSRTETYGQSVAVIQVTTEKLARENMPREEIMMEFARIRDTQLRFEARLLELERKK